MTSSTTPQAKSTACGTSARSRRGTSSSSSTAEGDCGLVRLDRFAPLRHGGPRVAWPEVVRVDQFLRPRLLVAAVLRPAWLHMGKPSAGGAEAVSTGGERRG